MKRAISLMIVCIIFLFHSACSAQKETYVTFYYKAATSDDSFPVSLIVSEERMHSVSRNDYSVLLQRYLAGPQDPRNESPFPAGTTLNRLTFSKKRAYITLSDEIASLSGTELSVACACLTKTIEEMTGVESVELSLVSSLINNDPYIILRSSDFAVLDDFSAYLTQQSEES